MGMLSNYLENKLIDHTWRGVAYTAPAGIYHALFAATAGQSVRSVAATPGQTTIPAAPNGHMYRCTTAGTTGAAEPTWPTAAGGTVTDGTAVWTEMTPDFEANANLTEVTGNAYARVNLAPSATNWSSTGGATTTTNPSAGTSGTTSNNVAIGFPTAAGGNWGVVAFMAQYDALTGGNMLVYGALTTPQVVNAGGTFSFNVSSLALTLDT
jgi:hypothetical protein